MKEAKSDIYKIIKGFVSVNRASALATANGIYSVEYPDDCVAILKSNKDLYVELDGPVKK
jgi:hypothetical protein